MNFKPNSSFSSRILFFFFFVFFFIFLVFPVESRSILGARSDLSFPSNEKTNFIFSANQHLKRGNTFSENNFHVSDLWNPKILQLKTTKKNGKRGNSESFFGEKSWKNREMGKAEIKSKNKTLRESREYEKTKRRVFLERNASENFEFPKYNHTLYSGSSALSAFHIWPSPWTPQPDRFLMSYCYIGMLTNRIMCLLHAIKYASILNRTLLVILDPKHVFFHIDLRFVFDIDFVRLCYGDNVVMTVEEYRRVYKKDVIIDQVLCANQRVCPKSMDFSHSSQGIYYVYQDGGVQFSKSVVVPEIPPIKTYGLTKEEVLAKFGNASGQVLFLGEFFYAPLITENQFDVPIKRSDQCHSNIAVIPEKIILESAKSFVRHAFQGEEFVAIHLRRQDFVKHCWNDKECFPPIEEIINCLKKKVNFFGARNIFLATNTDAKELALVLEALGGTEEEKVRIVQLETEDKENRVWAQHFINKSSDLRKTLYAEVDKIICTHASIFFGTYKSTYTLDVERLRYGFGTSNPRDSYLCENPTN